MLPSNYKGKRLVSFIADHFYFNIHLHNAYSVRLLFLHYFIYIPRIFQQNTSSSLSLSISIIVIHKGTVLGTIICNTHPSQHTRCLLISENDLQDTICNLVDHFLSSSLREWIRRKTRSYPVIFPSNCSAPSVHHQSTTFEIKASCRGVSILDASFNI